MGPGRARAMIVMIQSELFIYVCLLWLLFFSLNSVLIERFFFGDIIGHSFFLNAQGTSIPGPRSDVVGWSGCFFKSCDVLDASLV